MSDELIELPEAWKWTNLGDISEIIMGQSPPGDSYNQNGIGTPLINGPVEFGPNPFSKTVRSKFTTAPTKYCETNDLILCVRGSTTGRMNIAGFDACIGRGVAAIRSYTDQHYLNVFIDSKREDIYRLGTGSTFPNVSAETLSKIDVPLPPLNEQKRIVAKLEELRDRHQAAKQALEAVPKLCDRFRQSVLAAAFRGDLTADWREENPDIEPASVLLEKAQLIHKQAYKEECAEAKLKGERKPKEPTCLGNFELAWDEDAELPESWMLVPLGKVCMKITDGTHDTPKTVDKGIPYITAQHVKLGIIDFENSFFLPEQEHRIIYSRCNPERGDVLLVNIGAGTATPALISVDFEFSMKNIALLKPDKATIDSKYLEYYQAFIRPRIFSQVSRGGAQPFMGLNLIRTIPLVLPPVTEQKEIVARIKSLFEKLELIKLQYRETENYFDRFNQSILAKAFRGELVEQDPNDEPASVLLNRIRAEREALQGSKTKKSTKGRQRKTPNKVDEQLEMPGLG